MLFYNARVNLFWFDYSGICVNIIVHVLLYIPLTLYILHRIVFKPILQTKALLLVKYIVLVNSPISLFKLVFEAVLQFLCLSANLISIASLWDKEYYKSRCAKQFINSFCAQFFKQSLVQKMCISIVNSVIPIHLITHLQSSLKIFDTKRYFMGVINLKQLIQDTRAGLPQFLGWPEVLISFSLTLGHSVPRHYTSCRGVSPTS